MERSACFLSGTDRKPNGDDVEANCAFRRVYLVGNASTVFKVVVVCVALIRTFGTYACEFVRVTGISSTNTTCARPGHTMTATTSTYVAASKGRRARA